MIQDRSRTTGGEWDIVRGSEPAFVDTKLETVRHTPEPDNNRMCKQT